VAAIMIPRGLRLSDKLSPAKVSKVLAFAFIPHGPDGLARTHFRVLGLIKNIYFTRVLR
jgi:hypothetical protein